MADLSRYLRRPSEPEVFGLSTLDTVSCALGAAIILMILMASVVERGAPVQLTEFRQLREAGDGRGARAGTDEDGLETRREPRAGDGADGASEVANLATLFVDFEGNGASLHARAKAEPGAQCGQLTLALPSPPGDGGLARDRWALVVWGVAGCPQFTIDLEYGVEPLACEVTLVSGGHFEVRAFPECPGAVALREGGRHVYVRRRLT